jgi:hypothetical protein
MQCSASRAEHVQRWQAAAGISLAPVEQRQARQRVGAELLQRAPDAVDVQRDGLQDNKHMTKHKLFASLPKCESSPVVSA